MWFFFNSLILFLQILVWDGSSGECLINLKTGSSVLDLSGMKMNCKTYLTALTDKSLLLYGWNGV